MEVPARSIRVPLQYVEQDESKGIRSFLRCWLTAVKGHCCLAPHKGFLHQQEDSPPSLRYGSLSWQVYSRAGKRGAGAAVGKPLNTGKQSPKTCLWVWSQFSCFWESWQDVWTLALSAADGCWSYQHSISVLTYLIKKILFLELL